MSTERGELRVNATGNQTGFQQMLGQMRANTRAFAQSVESDVGKSWSGLGKSFAAGFAGMFAFESVKNIFADIVNTAKDLKDTSDMFDLSTDSIQRWDWALSKAGISQMTFFRSLETLRAKRAEARQDEKKMAAFSDIGLGAEARGAELSDEQLLIRILQSKGSRFQKNELLGRRGATLGAALGELNTSPIYSEDEIQEIDKQANEARTKWRLFKGALNKSIIVLGKLFTEEGWSILMNSAEENSQMWRDKALDKQQRDKAAAEEDKTAAESVAERERKEKADKEQAKADEQFNEKREALEKRLLETQRQSMTSPERRKSLEKDLAEIVAERTGLEAQDTLSNADQLRLLELKTQEAGLRQDLNPVKARPQVETDSLSRVGGFSASTLLFSPTLNLQQQQLQELRKVEGHLRALASKEPLF